MTNEVEFGHWCLVIGHSNSQEFTEANSCH
jgi:hypothetical protein